MYNGYLEVYPNDYELSTIYNNENIYDLLTNQYLIIKDSENNIIDKLRWDGEKFVHLIRLKIKNFKPLTVKQECLFDLLANEDIPIKLIFGCAGSGKSKCVMTAGLDFLNAGIFARFLIVRHNVSVGEKNGYLPGNKFQKIQAWLGFFEDNLNSQYTLEEMFSKQMIDVDSPEYMKGRDLKNSWIMVDESEDLTEDQFKMIGERVSENSIICFVGDYEQITQDKYKKSSGIKRAIENLAGHKQVGIIVFDDLENDNVRSDASKIFSYLY